MSEVKIPRYMKLKDSHPTMVKLQKLYELAEDLGIHISFSSNRTVVQDNDRDSNLPTLYMEDTNNLDNIEEWPPTFEYQVIYDNPAYLAEEKRKWAEYQAEQQAAAKKAERARQAATEKAKETKAREIEARERTELSRLKNKYKE